MTDLRILETIMAAIKDNEAPSAASAAAPDFARLLALCESQQYRGELWQYLAERPTLACVSMLPTVGGRRKGVGSRIDK